MVKMDAHQKIAKKHNPFDLVLFAKEELGIDVFLASMADNEYGELVYDDSATIPYIVINKDNGCFFNRFIIASKLGEYIYTRKYGVCDSCNKCKEKFSMIFARELLVPEKWFYKVVLLQYYRYYFIKLLKFLKFIDYEEYCEKKDLIIAKHFKVPTNIITIRKYELLGIV